MFNKKELSQLRPLVKTRIEQVRDDIKSCSDKNKQETLENELIHLVSVFNKLKRHAQEISGQSVEQKMPKILLVDDVESMRLITHKILKEMGFRRIEEARSAEQAFAVLTKASKTEPFDIVITDWEMADKTGLDLLRDIRINESLAGIHVYLLTSHSSQTNIMQAIEAGVTGYLVKPVNYNILSKKLEGYLSK